uniref:Methyltransferase n=1 Tax=Exserohilum turcicum polymycovirus 1 TaxID=3229045 RepID=A0AAU7YCF4_9VIRU
MFDRRSQVSGRRRPQRSVRRPSTTDRSPERPPSTSSFAVSVAKSSRSGASSVSGDRTGRADSVVLPLTLYEYGFDASTAPILSQTEVFSDPRGVDFLNSPAGRQLRTLERQYASTVTQYLNRSVRMAGRRVLVLGSGSAKSTASILKRGVQSATFVDVSEAALRRLQENVIAIGADATVEVEYVCEDAWTFLESLEGEEYDLILALKCVGLILASGPGRDTPGMLDMVADALNPDGSFITDHHAAFSTPEWAGRPIAVGMEPALYDTATIGGRYAADVGYSWDISHADLDNVLRFSTPAAPHDVQVWHVFHFRARHPADEPVMGATITARQQRAPATITAPPHGEFDPVVDAMIPVNNRGVKRCPVPADIGSYDISRARPKFDGHPALLVLDGNTALVLSPTRSFMIGLAVTVSPKMILAAEIVEAVQGGVVVVATGLIDIGGQSADPNDLTALESVGRVLEALLPHGILISLPPLLRQLRGDAVVLPGPNGRDVTLPVDGVNVVSGGVSGCFFKTDRGHTIDAKPEDLPAALAVAKDALLLPDRFFVAPAPPGVVSEFSLDFADMTWKPIRLRPDKTFSDNPGAVIHTVVASLGSNNLRLTGTIEDLAKRILR